MKYFWNSLLVSYKTYFLILRLLESLRFMKSIFKYPVKNTHLTSLTSRVFHNTWSASIKSNGFLYHENSVLSYCYGIILNIVRNNETAFGNDLNSQRSIWELFLVFEFACAWLVFLDKSCLGLYSKLCGAFENFSFFGDPQVLP